MSQRLPPLIDPVIRAASPDLPGVVALVSDATDTLYTGAGGVRDLATGAAMTPDTVFWIASMTKLVTVVAALQLLEQGKLEWDAPARRWCAQLAQVQVLQGFDAHGQAQLRPPKTPVTLRHLLTHTAGYAYEFFNADALRFQKTAGIPGTGTGRRAAFCAPLMFDPGTRWHYGMGIDVAGLVIEGATGMRLGDVLRACVLQPLGMTDTAFRLTPSMRARRAAVHMRADRLKPSAMVVEQNPEVEMGGGALYGTAEDYARLLRMILNRGVHQGARLLQESSIDCLLQNAIGPLAVTPLPSAMAHLAHGLALYPDTPQTWGLGGLVTQAPLPTGRAAGSLTWAGLANTYFWVDPAQKVAGVFMTQVLPFADPKALYHFQAFETCAYRALVRA